MGVNNLEGIEQLEEVIKQLESNPNLKGLGVRLHKIKNRILWDVLNMKIK